MSPTEQLHLHLQQYFHDASEAYEGAMRAFEDAAVVVGEAKVSLAEAREQLKDMEAEALVNGGHGTVYVQATSADKRNAQLRLALKAWPEYQEQRQQVALLERELAAIEAKRDAAANLMSLSKRRCDAHIANVARATAIATNAGMERKSNHG